MNEQDLFYPPPPTWTSKWCRGASYKNELVTKAHWAETKAGGDDRPWNRRQCPDCHALYCSRWWADRPEYGDRKRLERKERDPDYNSRYYHEHRDECREYDRNYRKTHRAEESAKSARYRARFGSSECEHGPACANETIRNLPHVCRYCGSDDDLQIDHRVPLKLGGKHCANNVQRLCKSCNCSKQDDDPAEYERRIGFAGD